MTEPPAPVPAVVLDISAPFPTEICGALTLTEPALPLAAVVAAAMIPLSRSVRLSGPCEPTWTVPALPSPDVLENTLAPPEIAIAPPAVNVTSPARPLDPGSAEAVMPLAPVSP